MDTSELILILKYNIEKYKGYEYFPVGYTPTKSFVMGSNDYKQKESIAIHFASLAAEEDGLYWHMRTVVHHVLLIYITLIQSLL